MKEKKYVSNLYTNLIFRMLFMIVLPFFIITIFLISKVQGSVNRDSMDINTRFVNQILNSIKGTQEQAEVLAATIEGNTTLINFLSQSYAPKVDFNVYNSVVYNFINGCAKSNSRLKLKIFIKNDSVPQGYGLFYTHEYLNDQGVLERFIKSKNESIWIDSKTLHEYNDSHPLYTAKESMVYIKSIKSFNYDIIGYIAIIIPKSDFIGFTDTESKKNVLQSNDNIYINFSDNKLDMDVINKINNENEFGSFKKTVYSKNSIERIPLTLFVISPKSNQSSDFHLFLLIFFVCLLILIAGFIKYIHKLVFDIQRCITETQVSISHNFKYRLHIKGNNEIATIAQSINLLLDEISNLFTKTMQQQLVVREAQLLSLQHQINPHFIYNTMEVFAGRMEAKGLYEESDALTAFAQLFRYNVNTNGHPATVYTETENVKRFLSIQHLSKPNINLTINISDEVMKMPLLRFVMQPIVENSLNHGHVSPTSPLNIEIQAKKTETGIHFVIKDNGLGIKKDVIDRLNSHFADDVTIECNSGSIGLMNINRRLKLFYGTSLKISSVEGNGTTVEFDTVDILNNDFKIEQIAANNTSSLAENDFLHLV